MLNPPIAAHSDHLARAVQCLDPVGLTKRRSHGSVVEGADNPLRSAFAESSLRDQSVLRPVSRREHRVVLGQIADRFAPRPADGCDPCCAPGSACLSNFSSHLRRSSVTLSQKLLSVLGVSRSSSCCRVGRTETDDAEHGRRSPSKHLLSFVDLDDGSLARQEFGIWIVGTHHQEISRSP